ncbi:MAG: zinc ABC transporter substrate-binding protein ZnuA [Candidatus Competibacteraceae bacterium]
MSKGNSSNARWQLKLLGMLLLCGPLVGIAAETRVVASIKPVHSLVAGVMEGVGEPTLLTPGGASPHEYSLRPSDLRAINEAQAVFWIGPDLETFLIKPLANVADRVRAVALMEAPDLTVLPLREGGAWEPHAHGHGDHERGHDHGHDHNQHDHGHDHVDRDAHVWLDPINAIAMVRQIVATVGEVDPAHQADYARNGAALIERLDQLNQRLATKLKPIQDRPYIVFHDAYQYFERRYGLNAVGSVVLQPEQRPGAKRVAEIQGRIRDLQARCVFSEPQFQPALVETVIAGSDARRGVLDPLGAELTAGPDAYFQLLQNLADALGECLGDS